MQRGFSQNAVHEFRTPLAVLKTRIGLFRKKQDFSPQTTEDFLLYPFLVKFNLIDHGRSFRFHRISDDGGLGHMELPGGLCDVVLWSTLATDRKYYSRLSFILLTFLSHQFGISMISRRGTESHGGGSVPIWRGSTFHIPWWG